MYVFAKFYNSHRVFFKPSSLGQKEPNYFSKFHVIYRPKIKTYCTLFMIRGVGMRFEMLGVKFGITNFLTAFTKNYEKYHINLYTQHELYHP